MTAATKGVAWRRLEEDDDDDDEEEEEAGGVGGGGVNDDRGRFQRQGGGPEGEGKYPYNVGFNTSGGRVRLEQLVDFTITSEDDGEGNEGSHSGNSVGCEFETRSNPLLERRLWFQRVKKG